MDDLVQYIENWTGDCHPLRQAMRRLHATTTCPHFTVLRSPGLELKQQTGMVPIYTVEHIERPTAD